jgi:PTH1 family peptidyl-tRNA hydrolase
LFKAGSPYLIAGLGNPGLKYVDTRHNVGFEMLDVLAGAAGIRVSKIKFKSLIGEGKISGHSVILAKPQTFMNASGEAIRDIMQYYKIPPDRLIVIFDDVSLDTGRIRIRARGSAGGHTGMKNIIYHLGTEDFPRIRIGIGHPGKEEDLIDYVLDKFPKDEINTLIQTAKQIPEIVDSIISSGVESAMNKYNAKT